MIRTSFPLSVERRAREKYKAKTGQLWAELDNDDRALLCAAEWHEEIKEWMRGKSEFEQRLRALNWKLANG